MKIKAMLRRVIEASFRAEHVVAIVGKAGVLRDLLPKLHELIKLIFKLFSLSQAPPGHQLPRLLPQWPIRLFEELAHCDERLLFTAELHSKRAAELLVLLPDLRLLGFQGHVFLAEQL